LSEKILAIDKLTKRYGKLKALDELSITIEKGNIYGILGPNGSGKTTTLGIVLDAINQSSGSFKWFGNDSGKAERKRIGAILETPAFYPYMSALKNLEIIADIKGVPYDEIPELLKTVDLYGRKNSKFKTFSLGMKQRLAIAAALIGNPEVLILDEPTNGLDPQGIAEIRNLIKRIAKDGLTIVLASHLLDEVQKVCTHVVVLEKGKKLFAGKVDEVLNESLMIEIAGPEMDRIGAVLEKSDFVSKFDKEDELFIVELKSDFDSSVLNKSMFEQGITISHISLRKKSLENYFLELLAESHDKTS
jgi:ABC-2 type transport system ATP-binding protein